MPFSFSRERLLEQLAAVRTRAEVAGATAVINELAEAHAWLEAGDLNQANSLMVEAAKRLDDQQVAPD